MNLDLQLQVLFTAVPVDVLDSVVGTIENFKVFKMLMSMYFNIQLQHVALPSSIYTCPKMQISNTLLYEAKI